MGGRPFIAARIEFKKPSRKPASVSTTLASRWSLSLSKRLFDVVFAVLILTISAVPMLLIAFLVRVLSKGPAIYIQTRVGRNGRLFSIYKFRSMTIATRQDAGLGLTKDGDSRITSLGRWLRRLKLDELPQFYNILRGYMSVVGPRPKLPQYAEFCEPSYRPGITGAATIAFRCEEKILSRVDPEDLNDFYHQRIKPLKTRIDSRYMRRATFWSDLRLITTTLVACFTTGRVPSSFRDLHNVPQAGTLSSTMISPQGGWRSEKRPLAADEESELALAE